MIENTMLSAVTQALGSAGTTGLSSASKASTPAEAAESFANFLKQALDGVAAQEKNVHTMNDQFILGNADVNDVMIAASKAELSLELTSQIRNKVIDAYQEIMRMSI
ncbi:flagellar hook-basal body complex protein FliE [Cohnella lubricantis]|uniref:Flagellar hook-basal body complex protein FliE n=1 Tax=Cohnella lubricantis TaxID=2163172 RepID=A0A841THN6_9BACL|nr:flagellar hook-basal body complex protein FliE [Cohnella lubricantis]MBB6679419.1 flagellar hook-basal body complex protein FliE [Cohnella lubricantis]MBP2117501.1 flagellar hook-basal body complex protein FliE [Cohnella lubricantis]